ncbi:phytoene desaturase family protein [Deinococcus yavapaiensis]|uniref:Phytoene dehydrogenase-like protein n=1 Tax=Deinococcus yavapaiensis KR-236 TaxID=694435 RepID=A0A318SJM9_9DEIO|nr:NAD(P)/FAD-dependent oxidoreductase [Deinococcus yavapaiensis]PYE54486.1 phytoene dehydrogenase-like protein [Deinococcus yavapaiensis KR-236]
MSAPRRASAPSVGIVGGGVGGLALACLLAHDGHDVVVYDAGPLGGKLGEIELHVHDATRRVSTGPSLFTFPEVWRRLLRHLGEADPLQLDRLPELGVHVVRGERLPIPVPEGHPLFEAWRRLEREVLPLAPHVETLLTTPPRFTNAAFLQASAALGRVVGSHFTAERWLRARRVPPLLHDALALHALNAGVGPRRGSALYALLPVLIARDVFRPRNGMYALVRALQQFARARGVRLRPFTPVRSLNLDGEVRLDGERVRHDRIVSALDPARLAELRGSRPRSGVLTVSGVAVYASSSVPTTLPTTTIVAPSNARAFEDAVSARAFPRDTMSLVHDHGDHLAVLLTVPPNGRLLDIEHPWVRGQLARLRDVIGLPHLTGAVLSPAHFASLGPLGGAIYGHAHAAWRSGPFHPEPYRIGERLWQVGTGVHPGGGLPAVLGGAMIVHEQMRGSLASPH